MLSTYTALTIAMMLPIMMLLLALSISKKMITDRQKLSPFECGFNPQTNARLPFSMQFFLISMLFLIFDIEIALILPLMPTMKTSKILIWSISSSLFLITLLMGLYFEWNQGMLKWAL